eukprot:scaffold318076_cov46-Prasinocladus_malaysianus.AAC.1
MAIAAAAGLGFVAAPKPAGLVTREGRGLSRKTSSHPTTADFATHGHTDRRRRAKVAAPTKESLPSSRGCRGGGVGRFQSQKAIFES